MVDEGLDICNGPKLSCMTDIFNKIGQFDHVENYGQKVKCLPSCEDQIYTNHVTSFPYPIGKSLRNRPEFCIIAKRLVEKCQGPKKSAIERKYPNICTILEPLKNIEFCTRNIWYIRR